jgi:hypothetical protein
VSRELASAITMDLGIILVLTDSPTHRLTDSVQ